MLLTSFPTSDLESGKFDLGANLVFANPEPFPAIASEGVAPSAFRLADDAVLDGERHTVYCSSGLSGNSAIIKLYRTAAGRLSESVCVEDMRFGYGRYGIMTPFEADRPSSGYTIAEWYTRGGHIVRNVWGQAYERCIRIAARNTLIEDFAIQDVGGTTAEPDLRVMAIDLLGPNPIIRRGIVRRLVHVPQVSVAPEAVGVSFSADCDGGLIEDVEISNPAQLPHLTIGIWLGHSAGVTVRRVRVANMKYAIDMSGASGVVEDCQSINCEFGFAHLANDARFKLRNVWDYKFVNGAMTATDVSNV